MPTTAVPVAGERATTVVCFGYPARGHTVPSLPVVAELCRRGMCVYYYSTPAFRMLVEGSGAQFCSYPPCCDSLTTPHDLDDHLVRGLTVTAELLPQLLEQVPQADLVLFDASALWGSLFARQRGVPAVASNTTFALNRSLLQLLGASAQQPPRGWNDCAAALALLNQRYAAGIRDHLDLMVPAADLTVVYTSRLFQPGGRYFAANHLFVGPLLQQRVRDGAALRAAAAQHDDKPLAYVSLGTIFNQDHALLRRIAGVLATGGWRVLVSLGSASAQPGDDWPAGVEVQGFVDQIGVLTQASLFVTHGGMNSVSEALALAVPMLVIPQGVDQHLVARQAASLGAARVLEREQTSSEQLQAAIDAIRHDHARHVAAAVRIQQSFDDVTPLPAAVDAMLALLQADSAENVVASQTLPPTPSHAASAAVSKTLSDAQEVEAATLSALFNAAQQSQQAQQGRATPRFLLEAARSMAAHLNLDDAQMQQSLDALALWQWHLPTAMAGSRWDFAMVRERLPASFACMQQALLPHEARPQVVAAAFHMAAFPLICSLVGAAWRSMHTGPLHMVIATHNLGWLRRDHSSWIGEHATIIGTQPQDLRRLLAGLRAGEIRRLLILVDGPHAPGRAGTRALTGVSATLGFRTALLERIHALGIPLLPFTHHFAAQQLVVQPQPLLDPQQLDADATVAAVANHIETLLRAQPAQWLNWAAARIRT